MNIRPFAKPVRPSYKPSVSGAIEALASNGGQIMPPIMGAAAFILAAFSGVAYIKVAIASLIPALLYFGGLLWYVHLEAHKIGLVGLPKEDTPNLGKVLIRGGHLFLPLAVLIEALVYGFSPVKAAFYGIIATIIISWFRKETRLGPKEILAALEAGGKNAVMIIITCATVRFIIGGFLITGLGLNVSSAIINIAGGYLILSLFLVGLSSIVLGMGMNTVAAFVLVSVVGVPALTAQGIDPLVANIFVFYFALLSHITPPVCLAIFAGAQIAGASIWETAYMGVKMSAVPYLLPFLVVFVPSLLLIGTPQAILLESVSATLGFMFLISSIQGWALQSLAWPGRILYCVTGACMLWSDLAVKGTGLVLGAVLIAFQYMNRDRETAEEKPSQSRT